MKAYIQIAGALDRLDADNLVRAGVDEIALPVGPGLATPELNDDSARDLFAYLAGRVKCLAITYLTEANGIVSFLRELGVSRVQLHGDVGVDEIKRLKGYGEFYVLKAFAVGQLTEVELQVEIRSYESVVDGFLFDTFDRESQATGATGKTHDWQISRRLVAITERPVILAGGLDENNVADAIRAVRPFGVDAHTRLESADGYKDFRRVCEFVRRAKEA